MLFFCKGGQLKTKLYKLLFYADSKHFKENAVSITGARYVHLPHGPVPDHYEYFFATLIHSGDVDVDEIPVYQYCGENLIATREADLVDEEGNRKAVVVPISSWQQILEALDELDDIRAYDEAKREHSDPIPFGQAVSEIRERMSD